MSDKDLEIVSGDGNDLTNSPVYEHIKLDKSSSDKKKKKDIVIPKGEHESKKNKKSE